MIPPSRRVLPSWVIDGLRGGIVGFVVFGALALATTYAGSVIDRHPEIDGPETLGSTVLITLEVGIPSALVLGLLIAWATRLPRPWAVSLLGLMNSGLLICGYGSLRIRVIEPRWLVPVSLIVLAHVLTAVLVARSARSAHAVTSRSR
ncbi:hypothetical protein GCM10022379_37270 [Micromonospora maritima]